MPIRFALNHRVAPSLGLEALFALARRCGITEVEIRNDLSGRPILDGTPAADVRRMAEAAGIELISLNALQKFNHWSAERAAEAEALADYCAAAGVAALVLVAANDGPGRGEAERVENAATAIAGLLPILSTRGIIGLVECLGFESCSLRRKSEALRAIDAAGGGEQFRLVHDSFHHHLAGEGVVFPGRTGLVHISGVEDPAVRVADMRDCHRGLVGPGDLLGNVRQIAALEAGGYRGPLSFEPFAAEVAALANPQTTIEDSMQFIRARLAAKAA
jgi:2-keto-myo-inositol isomerase